MNPPKKLTWLISLILVVIGVVANFVAVPVVSGLAFWFVTAGAVLLILAAKVKGL